MLRTQKHVFTIVLALCVMFTFLLTACTKGNDAPPDDTSVPAITDTQTPDSTPDATEAPDSPTASRYDFSKLSQFTPEIKKPSMDISKYFSANETEFDIVQCARDLGFDVSHTAELWNSPLEYNIDDEDPEKAEGKRQTKKFFLDERAKFLFEFFYKGNSESRNIQGADYQYVSIFLDIERDYFFIENKDPKDTFTYNAYAEVWWSFSYPVKEGSYTDEKTIKLLGRPEEDNTTWEDFREVYVNRAILDFWVWSLEQISKGTNDKDPKSSFYDELIYKEFKQKLDLIGFDVTQNCGLYELDLLGQIMGASYWDLPRYLGFVEYDEIKSYLNRSMFVTEKDFYTPTADISKYYNGNEFNFIQCAADLGYDASTSRVSSFSPDSPFFAIDYPCPDGKSIQFFYNRMLMLDGEYRRYMRINYSGGGDDLVLIDLADEGNEIKIVGMTDGDGTEIFVSRGNIACMVWLLEQATSVESWDYFQYCRDIFADIFAAYDIYILYTPSE